MAGFVGRLIRYALAVLAVLVLGVLFLIVVYAVAPPPASALMIAQSLQGRTVTYQWTPMEKISRHLVRAVIVSEDARFCTHRGVDWDAMEEAVEDAEKGEKMRGASTIPMQAMKNLFLWPRRSILRKAIEIPLASFASMVWSKHRMLEIYLNIAEWAPGVFGAEAAALHHFKKSAARLDPREAARLAAALPNPYVRNAARPGPKTRARAARILREMKSGGMAVACVLK